MGSKETVCIFLSLAIILLLASRKRVNLPLIYRLLAALVFIYSPSQWSMLLGLSILGVEMSKTLRKILDSFSKT